MGTKNNPAPNDCYAKAEPDEPMFVLLARDPYGPSLIYEWIRMRTCLLWHTTPNPMSDEEIVREVHKLREASKCATAMYDWKRARDEERWQAEQDAALLGGGRG